MPQRPCSHSGCSKLTKGYSHLCPQHRTRKRRFGDTSVTTGIRKTLLIETRKKLGRWIASRDNADATETLLLKKVEVLVEEAKRTIQALLDHLRKPAITSTGVKFKPFVSKGVALDCAVAEDILKVVGAAGARTAALHLASVSYLWHGDHNLLPSDRAALFAYARAWRSLAPQTYRRSFSHKTGKSTTSIVEAPPAHLAALGQKLAEHLAVVGAIIHLKQIDEAKAAEEARIGVMKAIEESRPKYPAKAH